MEKKVTIADWNKNVIKYCFWVLGPHQNGDDADSADDADNGNGVGNDDDDFDDENADNNDDDYDSYLQWGVVMVAWTSLIPKWLWCR